MESGVITNLISILSDIGVTDRSKPRDVRLTKKELTSLEADRVIYFRDMSKELRPPAILDRLLFRDTAEYTDILHRYRPQIDSMILKPQATILPQGHKLPENALSFVPPPLVETNLVRVVEPCDSEGKLKRGVTEEQCKDIAKMLLKFCKELEQSGLGDMNKEVSATGSKPFTNLVVSLRDGADSPGSLRDYEGMMSRAAQKTLPGQVPRTFPTPDPYADPAASAPPRTAKPCAHRDDKRDAGPRIKVWEYGPGEVGIWHTDMPPFLHFGETIQIASWSRIKLSWIWPEDYKAPKKPANSPCSFKPQSSQRVHSQHS